MGAVLPSETVSCSAGEAEACQSKVVSEVAGSGDQGWCRGRRALVAQQFVGGNPLGFLDYYCTTLICTKLPIGKAMSEELAGTTAEKSFLICQEL